ncbi:muscle, skeletal receptor tyrosine protein kinase-like [Diadema setosum]|uniref:muscle, skeletal receptor tyrosine protein kinase-like n=1 Tax=Diadema setosum TaxID=31175 RepID=UPI003B3A4559
MMWRLYVVAVPLLWLYLITITYGNTNDTVVDPSQESGQPISGTPLQDTSTGLIHNGTNNSFTTVAATVAATEPASVGAGKVPVDAMDTTTTAIVPDVAANATRTTLLSTMSQTMLQSDAPQRTTMLNESIPTTSAGSANGNHGTTRFLETSSIWNVGNTTIKGIDYLSNVSSTATTAAATTTTTTARNTPLLDAKTTPAVRPPGVIIREQKPIVLQDPRNKTVEFGSEVMLRCKIESISTPELWWEVNGKRINRGFGWQVRTQPLDTQSVKSVIKVKGVSLEHAGRYQCLARNEGGTVASRPAYLIVEMAPDIIEGPGNHSVLYGTELNLTCKVQAFPPPKIAWFRNLEPLSEWTNSKFIIINATQTANYTCFYRNEVNGEDKLAAKAGLVTIIGARPNYCARYNGATCRGRSIGNPHMFVNGKGDEIREVDQRLRRVLSSESLLTTSALCQDGIQELLCHATYPDCASSGTQLLGLPVCRTDCMKVHNACGRDWGRLANGNFDGLASSIRRLKVSSCENLPDTRCTKLWEDVPHPSTTSSPSHISTSGGDITTLRLPTKMPRLPTDIQEPPIHSVPENSPMFLILVITVPTGAVVFVAVAIITIILVKRHNYPSEFKLPKNIDLSGLVDNPMYGKSFNPSFNPQLAYLEYNRNSVIYEKDIGEGAFGRVFKATAPSLVKGDAETSVAVKMLKSTADRAVTEYFNREAEMIARFSHQNIIRLLGVCFVGKPLCLLLEYMAEGDLEDFLHSRSPHPNQGNSRASSRPAEGLKTYQKLNMARQVANGLVYLRERRFVHRDIATRNCLVSSNLDVKISDFGLARYLGPKDKFIGHKEEHIPIRWTAPEALWFYQFTFASDVWSFGVLLWELFTYAQQPYSTLSHEDVFLHTRQGYRLECPENTPQQVYKIMRQCWEVEPADRLPFKLVRDKLASMEFEWLANGEESPPDPVDS